MVTMRGGHFARKLLEHKQAELQNRAQRPEQRLESGRQGRRGRPRGSAAAHHGNAYGRPESLNTDDYRACPVVLPAAPLRDSALVPSGGYFFRPCGRSSARGGEPGHRSQDGRAPGHARSLRPPSCSGRQRGVDWVEVHRHRAPARAPGKSFREVREGETVESLQPRQEGAVGCTAGTGW